jgi:hypothetical protein
MLLVINEIVKRAVLTLPVSPVSGEAFQFSFHSNVYEANFHYRGLKSFTSKIFLATFFDPF